MRVRALLPAERQAGGRAILRVLDRKVRGHCRLNEKASLGLALKNLITLQTQTLQTRKIAETAEAKSEQITIFNDIICSFEHFTFLAHFCQSKEGQEKLMGMSTGAAQSVINTKSVATLKIPFPSMEKQKSIAERLDNLCQHCSELASLYRKKSEQLISLKSAILVKELRSDSL